MEGGGVVSVVVEVFLEEEELLVFGWFVGVVVGCGVGVVLLGGGLGAGGLVLDFDRGETEGFLAGGLVEEGHRWV